MNWRSPRWMMPSEPRSQQPVTDVSVLQLQASILTSYLMNSGRQLLYWRMTHIRWCHRQQRRGRYCGLLKVGFLARACTHKIAVGGSDLLNACFGPLCGLKSDISRGPKSGREQPQTNDANSQPFSSRFSSLKKRQSVPCAMILLGADLIIPASRSRREKKRIVSSGS
jgi:hypothetical protein